MTKYRSTKIELNGSMEQFQQRLLLLSMPIWLIMLPGLSLTISPAFALLAMSITVCCIYRLFALRRSQIIFEKDNLRLPGALRLACKYSDIQSVGLERQNLYVKAVNKDHPYKFSLGNLSKENAEMLWTLMAQKLRTAKISPAVRAALMAKSDGSTIASTEAPGDDLQIIILMGNDYQVSKILSYMSQYDVIFDVGFFRAWTIFWTGFGGIALAFLAAEEIPALSAVLHTAVTLVTEIFNLFGQLIVKLDISIGFFGFVLTVVLCLYYLLKKWMEPDSIVVNKQGITPQLHVPTGSVAQENISWPEITSINLLGREDQKSASTNGIGIIEIKTNTDRLPLAIPLRAFHDESTRGQFLEALKTWGSEVSIDPKLLELFTPANEITYTELWLSSLEQAPGLNQLTPLQAGDKLEHHSLVIKQQLASGGQGVTYLAEMAADPADLPTTVVLKEIILPLFIDSAKKRITERFERDAKLLKSLDHQQIVKLHDYFIEGHRAFLMLEYVEGKTLRDKVLTEGPLNENEVVAKAEQMLAILEYLHHRTPPVVHRDFTPDNLLLNQQGQIKLLDFDVALQSAEITGAKATIVGKHNFLPPEQFRGYPCPQSDFYAMGATLYFMLTGSEPEALGCSHPNKIIDSINPIFDQFIATATEPTLDKRFNTIEQMKEFLSRVREGQ